MLTQKLDEVFALLGTKRDPEPVRCIRCGRELKDKESIAAGIGPICEEKEKEEGDLE